MKPNTHLKRERERRGWSQAKVADEIGTTEKNVSRWERGVSFPYPYYREKLCTLFGKSAGELGFVKDDEPEVAISGNAEQREQHFPLPLYDPSIPPVPNEGKGLVGRAALLDAFAEQLCTHTCLALSGLPGVGKTALAILLTQHPFVQQTFSDGVLWAGLGLRPNVLEQLNRWGMLLGLPVLEATTENNLEVRALALRAAIGTRRFLLVVDDAWELEAALPFKVGGPNCALLVTTRFPRIALTLTRDGAHTVPELNQEEGLLLLSQFASSVVAHDKHAAQTLVQEVGGLPLALTLLGKYLDMQAHSGQPRRLQAALTRLRNTTQRLLISEPQAPLERSTSLATGTPLSLQSIIAASDIQLDEQARAVLRALSVFPAKPNSFSEEAALMVAQTSAETLDVLYDAGLLESSGPERYTLHQTIADYANTHLFETLPGERLATYCTLFVESHATDDETLEQECRNLLAGLKYAFENGQHALLIRGVNAFAPFLLARGLHDIALPHLQRAYQVAIWSGDTRSLTLLLLHLGRVMYLQGSYNQAEVYLRESLSLAYESEYQELHTQLLHLLHMVALQQGNPTQAEVYVQEAQIPHEYKNG
jgi:transcriptional regulator with XRE-family HTH domain/tetratricopeptide (TPR) repeat protein